MKVLKKHRTKIKFIAYAVFLMMSGLIGRMTYVVVFRGEELTVKATELHERERAIKAGRGRIISSDGTVLATNETVCTVSVIHSQIKDPERVISILSEELDMDEEKVRKYVEKFSSMEKIKSNVPKETGDAIRSYELAGVKVDEDSKRIYPYSELASKILGFTGADNQGILGLEIEYDDVLKGTNGQILTLTDASGVEIEEKEVKRVEPVAGDDLYISIDYNIQSYATQLARTAYYSNQAKSVSIIVMDPDNGEMLAMVNYPEYNLNDPIMKKAVFSIFKSLIIAYIVTGVLLLLAALLMQKIGLNDNQVRLFVILIYGVSNIVSGFIFGKMRKNRRLLNGIIIGVAYFAMLVLISAIINKGFENELGKNIISLVICILGGAIGGIMS